MIRALILAFAVTISGVIVGILQKKKLNIWRHIFLFFLMFFIYFALDHSFN